MAYQDFTVGYTETDPNGRLTVAANKIMATVLTANETANVLKDFGAGYFGGDFTHQFECQYSNLNGLFFVHGLENADGTDGTFLDMEAGYGFIFYVSENDAPLFDTELFGSAASTTYYITLHRDDDGGANSTGQYTLEIRTGSHTGVLQETLSIDSSAG